MLSTMERSTDQIWGTNLGDMAKADEQTLIPGEFRLDLAALKLADDSGCDLSALAVIA